MNIILLLITFDNENYCLPLYLHTVYIIILLYITNRVRKLENS